MCENMVPLFNLRRPCGEPLFKTSSPVSSYPMTKLSMGSEAIKVEFETD
ncbi:hypothetical protein [Sulfolobus acidocaldarius]|nr:hypothetical protein [Sulfolobus acidocaldarius]